MASIETLIQDITNLTAEREQLMVAIVDLQDRADDAESANDRLIDELAVVTKDRDRVTGELEELKDTVEDVITTLGGRNR